MAARALHLFEAGVVTEQRFIGLQEAPATLGPLLADRVGAEKRVRIPFNPRERWLSAAREACRGLSDGVLASLRDGATPVVLGGECTIVAGALAGALTAALALALGPRRRGCDRRARVPRGRVRRRRRSFDKGLRGSSASGFRCRGRPWDLGLRIRRARGPRPLARGAVRRSPRERDRKGTGRGLTRRSELFASLSALARPISLAAIAPLLLSAHVSTPLWPSFITGKLSDVAGLYFTPYVVLAGIFALPIAMRGKGPVAIGCAVYLGTAAIFAALKLSAATADPLLSLASLFGFPVAIATDPTDLIALAVLPPSFAAWS